MAHSTEFHEWLLSMYVRATIRFVVMAVLLALISSAANAAVVVLKNGDRITGRIVKMEDRKLEIDSDVSSDIVTIKWEQVRSITTERPMSVKL